MAVPQLSGGWAFLQRTRILSGIQFTTHFIEFFDVETKLFVTQKRQKESRKRIAPPPLLDKKKLKVGLSIADSQWNAVYNAFHRNLCRANEKIRRWFCTRDLDVANLRAALQQACGKQTSIARKSFFRAIGYVHLISKCRGD